MDKYKFAKIGATLSNLITTLVIHPSFALHIFQVLVATALLTFFTGMAFALELPMPETLELQYGLHSQTISVIEPHESTADRPVVIRYIGVPMNTLLNLWFGNSWNSPDTEVVFFARDGYHSAIPSSKLKRFHAYLTFKRDDGVAFVLNNPEQNQKNIMLNPYYLVWDNLASPELLQEGSNGWPYQISRIELRRTTDDRALLPANATKNQTQGFMEAKQYCLTCHHIQNLGGEKYPEDLVQASCRWTDAELKTWIDNPNQMRSGTTMPPLSKLLLAEERSHVIERIVLYLRAMKIGVPTTCANGSKQP
jgi:cytochrome c2